MLCGRSLFPLWALRATLNDVNASPKRHEYQQRTRDLGDWKAISWHCLVFFDYNHAQRESSIWSLVETYYASYCSDPRDRVFGLLSLADYGSHAAFRPDYTISATGLLIALISFKAREEFTDISTYNFQDALLIIGAFGMGPENREIAAMQQQRMTTTCTDGSCPNALAKMQHWYPDLWEYGYYFHRRPRLVADFWNQSLFTVEATYHCNIRKSDDGGYLVPLQRSKSYPTVIRHTQVERYERKDVTNLRTFGGMAVGLASKHIRDNDTLLLFASPLTEAVFHAGLIVRRDEGKRAGSTVAGIVGQCIVDSDVKVCQGDAACACESRHPPPHTWNEYTAKWRVHLSSEDLLMFIAQDLKVEHTGADGLKAPEVNFSARLDESINRLRTSVTSDGSSYAELKEAVLKLGNSDIEDENAMTMRNWERETRGAWEAEVGMAILRKGERERAKRREERGE